MHQKEVMVFIRGWAPKRDTLDRINNAITYLIVWREARESDAKESSIALDALTPFPIKAIPGRGTIAADP